MAPRQRLMSIAGTVAAAVCLAGPALGESIAAPSFTIIVLPTYDYLVPTASQGGTFDAKDDPAPDQQAPPPPSGCPFRDGKLELIV
jgi:hypothetical protein